LKQKLRDWKCVHFKTKQEHPLCYQEFYPKDSKKRHSVLVIADTHLPFEREGYLDFCLDIQKRVKCQIVVHIGDLVDNHSISYHEHDPNGQSPIDEMKKVDVKLKDWFKAFPELYLCRGNHDVMVDRKGKTVGLPQRAFKEFRDIWQLPDKWYDDFHWEIDGVTYQHGTGYCGDNAHIKAAYNNRVSTVIGHTHSFAGVGYIANEKSCVFGMNVGSGVERHSYAMSYGKDFKRKPILSCGVVTDNGRYGQVFAMEL
jgi:predicted phosphodiesterase